MQMKRFVLLIALSFAAKQSENFAESNGNCGEKVNENGVETVFVKIEEDEYAKINRKEKVSQHIGVSYREDSSKWQAQRYSKHEKKNVYNGYYDNEETAAHASDTLARKFMANGEQGHKLNFPEDHTEVLSEKNNSSQYIGVIFYVKIGKWQAQRHSKHEQKMFGNGCHENEEKAARASDTLAKRLMTNGEKGHKLNFPNDDIQVFPEERIKSSQYIGVSSYIKNGKWQAQRRSKQERKMIYNGIYKNEETAAHASDTLARKLMKNGEQGHKLNFPNDDTEVIPEERQRKRKRSDSEDLNHPKNN